MRSIDVKGSNTIPTWSLPVTHPIGLIPPPTFEIPNVQLTNEMTVPGSGSSTVGVVVILEWEMPDLGTVDSMQTERDSNSTQVRQQINSFRSSPSSGMGPGSGDGHDEPVELGELTAVYAYVGISPLSPFSASPRENVMEFKVHVQECIYGKINCKVLIDGIEKVVTPPMQWWVTHVCMYTIFSYLLNSFILCIMP